MKNNDILGAAIAFATKCHTETNHLYDGKPYHEAHLSLVDEQAVMFLDLIPENDQPIVRGGVWTHDTIEDCRVTFNDVKKATNERVAELAYALTNEKGRTRKDRANEKYYKGIRQTQYATFIKLCDRIANVKYSLMKYRANEMTAGSMYEKYMAENKNFVTSLVKPDNILAKILYSLIRSICGKNVYRTLLVGRSPYKRMIWHLESLFE